MLILLDPALGHNTPGKRSPDGTRWHTATGRSCYTTKGHTLSDPLADCLYQSARHTHCPAVLIENFFMDNKQDLAYFLSQEGRRDILEIIMDGIGSCVPTLVSGKCWLW